MTEQTNIGNTYVNLDELTVSGLLGNLTGALDGPLSGLGLTQLLSGLGSAVR